MSRKDPELSRMKWLTRCQNYHTGVKDLFRRDVCSYCGGPGGTVDHIHPRPVISGHPRGNFMNYAGACEQCNFEKGAEPHFLFFFAAKQGRPVEGYELNPGFRG